MQPWVIPNYIAIAAVLAGLGLGGFLVYGLLAP